jgi:hypothetical protein
MRLPLEAAALALLVGGCATDMRGYDGREPVPVAAILNQVKCEIAQGLLDIDRTKLDITGWKIVGKLTTEIVVSRSLSGGVGGPDGPAILPLGAGATLGFNFGGSYSSSATTKAIADFLVSSRATSTRICEENQRNNLGRVVGIGVREWLQSFAAVNAGEPRMAVTALDYSLVFAVKRSGEGGATIQVLPIKANLSAAAGRDDTQTLALTFTPPAAAVAAATRQAGTSGGAGRVGVPGSGGVTFFSIRPSPAGRIQDIESNHMFLPEPRR